MKTKRARRHAAGDRLVRYGGSPARSELTSGDAHAELHGVPHRWRALSHEETNACAQEIDWLQSSDPDAATGAASHLRRCSRRALWSPSPTAGSEPMKTKRARRHAAGDRLVR